jgi:soluble lytic murein transglycosylase
MTAFSLRKLARCAILAAAFLISPGPAAAAPEDDFLAARDAYRVGDARKLDYLATRLRGYVLEPYVAYWQLRLRLEELSPADVRSFLATYGETPVARSLLADWLKLLGRTQQWALFDVDYALYSGEDLEITCYGIQSKVRTQPEAIAEARSLWFVVKDLPDSCTTLLSALMQQQKLTEQDIWARVRLALEAGQVALAQRAAIYLPPGTQPDIRALNMIFTNPTGYLDRQQVDIKTRGGRETVMFAVHRIGRSSPQQAAAYWARVESVFRPEERAYIWGLLAQFAAMRQDPEALQWFAKARDLSDTQLAWKARAALRARNWREVQAAIDAMTPAERDQSTWRYWKARALKATGRESEAVALLKPVAREYSFYGQLALEELGEKIATPPTAFTAGPEEISAMTQNPTVRRALEFYRLNLRVEATREWIWLVRNLDDRQLLTAAEVARRYQLYDRAINTADKTETLHDFTLRYIAPYR